MIDPDDIPGEAVDSYPQGPRLRLKYQKPELLPGAGWYQEDYPLRALDHVRAEARRLIGEGFTVTIGWHEKVIYDALLFASNHIGATLDIEPRDTGADP